MTVQVRIHHQPQLLQYDVLLRIIEMTIYQSSLVTLITRYLYLVEAVNCDKLEIQNRLLEDSID